MNQIAGFLPQIGVTSVDLQLREAQGTTQLLEVLMCFKTDADSWIDFGRACASMLGVFMSTHVQSLQTFDP